MADVFKRFPSPAAECVWAHGVCLPVCAPGSLPQGWLLRVMVTCILTPRPWPGCPLGLESTLAGSERGSGHPSVP